MSEADILQIMQAGLWTAFVISLPILFGTLIVGTLIGLFQALTSIQELTLTFVPKLGAIFLIYWLTMGFMSTALVTFFQTEIVPLIALPVR